eukprot:5521275-Amphidinium_carterae.1
MASIPSWMGLVDMLALSPTMNYTQQQQHQPKPIWELKLCETFIPQACLVRTLSVAAKSSC